MITVSFTIPDGPLFDENKLIRELAKGIDTVVGKSRDDFKSTYPRGTWQVQNARYASGKVSGSTFSDDEWVARINYGTPTRQIVSRGRKPMRFRVGYHPATWRGVIGAGRAQRSGPWRSTRVVKSHSITARETDWAIATRYRDEPQRIALEALDASFIKQK